MNNWQEVKLGDVCSIIDGDRGKNYPKENDFSKSGYCLFLNTKNVPNTKFDFSDSLFISEEKDNSLRKGKIKYGDIVVTTRGTLANFAYYTQDCKFKNIRINSGMVILRNEKQCIYTPYLYHFLMSINFKQQVNSFASGSAQPQLPIKDMKNIAIPFPPVDMQRKIAEVLRVLDAKIELNNAINNNLEQQAQALFKSWFVDFEPFGGKIPKDWKENDIYSISEIIYGAPFSSKLFNTDKRGMPVIRIRDLKNQHSDTYTEEVHPKSYIIKAGDIVVGMDGEFKPYIWGNYEGLLNQRVCVFKNKRSLGKMFLYLTIKPLLNKVEQTEVATTVIHIGKQDFDAFRYNMPSNDVMDRFDKITNQIYNKIVSNSLENTRLAELRDALLPKLMSGEIDVSNVNIDDLASADKLSFTEE